MLSGKTTAVHIQSWRQNLIKNDCFSVNKNFYYKAVAGLLLVLCLFASWHMRYWQYQQWEKRPNYYFASSLPSFSTTDAAYFIKKAIDIKTYGDSQKYEATRNYPDNLPVIEKKQQDVTSTRNEPLLSVIISYLSDDKSKSSIIRAAHNVLLGSVVLTSLSVLLAFGVAGYWYEGAAAALGSSLSSSFLGRTSAGRIDTDQLNLGFFYLVLTSLILTSRTKSILLSSAMCAMAATFLQLFQWWWHKPILNWIFVFILIWLSFWFHKSYKRTTLLALLFALLSGSFSLSDFGTIKMVAEQSVSVSTLSFPNTYKFVTELTKLSLIDLLISITGNVLIAALGFLGFVLWLFVSPALAIAFLPALLLGASNIVFGNRVVFFAAPVIWFGFAYVTLISLKLLIANKKVFKAEFYGKATDLMYGFSAILLIAATYLVSYNPITAKYVPSPVFKSQVISGLESLGNYQKKVNGDKPAVIATWWDYGYAAHLYSGLTTLNDGGSQRTSKTHFIARSLVSKDQNISSSILKFVASPEWRNIVDRATSASILENKIATGLTSNNIDLYLFLTNDMVRWMPPISRMGFWNTQTGKPLKIYRGSNRLHYEGLTCDGSAFSFSCNGQLYNLRDGTIDGQKILSRAIQTNNGSIVKEYKYANNTGPTLQFNQLNEKPLSNFLVHPKIFQSTFHELFFLGKYDPRSFEPVIDGYPYYRIYKIH